ncbi:MAG: hypothetical protein A2W19_11675 [Spirochaetes bacterium RBG_16_49_21]|nr:MAG: hypothetical protein A2W19_11675 [Spirochaetes bacterium RBG_16_49_21]
MKNLKVFFIIATAIATIFVLSKFFNFGFLRNFQENADKRIEGIRDKIEDLEKEKIKDVRTLARLADQYTQLGTIYLEKRLWDSAVQNYDKGIKYGKNTPGVFYSIGLAHANRGSERESRDDIDKAEFYYHKAIEMQSNYYDAQNALAILLFYHKNEKEKALSIIEGVVSRNKSSYIARFTLGRFYYEMNNLDKALSVYEDLESDLAKLPPSGIINEFKSQCRENIQRIMSELSMRKSK